MRDYVCCGAVPTCRYTDLNVFDGQARVAGADNFPSSHAWRPCLLYISTSSPSCLISAGAWRAEARLRFSGGSCFSRHGRLPTPQHCCCPRRVGCAGSVCLAAGVLQSFLPLRLSSFPLQHTPATAVQHASVRTQTYSIQPATVLPTTTRPPSALASCPRAQSTFHASNHLLYVLTLAPSPPASLTAPKALA